MRLKHGMQGTTIRERVRELLTRHKDRIEAATVTTAIAVPEYFLGTFASTKIGILGAVCLYTLGGTYPTILEKMRIRKSKNASEKTRLFRRMFTTGEFLAGIPAIPAFYITMRYMSDDATTNHAISVACAWFAARIPGVITWGALTYLLERERYAIEGLGKIKSIPKDMYKGFRKRFSEFKMGTYNEIAELFGYMRRIDWYAVLTRPLSMLAILAFGYDGRDAFEIYGWTTVPALALYYSLYFSPKVYPDASEILEAKKEANERKLD